jgi:hypothetical protein
VTDLYSAIGQKLGTSREEAKRRVYQRMYSAASPAVEVLGPEEPVPAAVRYPQVVETREEIARMGWVMTTRAGQRFFVGQEVAHNIERTGTELTAHVVLDAALRQHRAVWL